MAFPMSRVGRNSGSRARSRSDGDWSGEHGYGIRWHVRQEHPLPASRYSLRTFLLCRAARGLGPLAGAAPSSGRSSPLQPPGQARQREPRHHGGGSDGPGAPTNLLALPGRHALTRQKQLLRKLLVLRWYPHFRCSLLVHFPQMHTLHLFASRLAPGVSPRHQRAEPHLRILGSRSWRTHPPMAYSYRLTEWAILVQEVSRS